MKGRFIDSLMAATIVAATWSVGARPAVGQAAAAGTQSYNPPRTPDGKPDLQGVWRVWNLAKFDIEDHAATWGVPAGRGVVEGGVLPYQPAAAEKKKENFVNSRTSDAVKSADPLAKCYLPGVPRIKYLGFPFQILEVPNEVEIVYEWRHTNRHIYPPTVPSPEGWDFWLGSSRGHWEGNTLVVNVTNFNDKTWFDMAGNFHSDALHEVERYTLTSPDTLLYEVTVEDPKVFTRPWKMSMVAQRQKDIGLLDYECHALLEETGVPLTWPRE